MNPTLAFLIGAVLVGIGCGVCHSYSLVGGMALAVAGLTVIGIWVAE